MDRRIVLVPSPVTGPLVWAPVSRALRARGIETLIAGLEDDADSPAPFWVQHAGAVARRLERLPGQEPVVLVGHSGAGPLLPAIGAFSPHPVAGYVFADAGLPIPGRSQLQEMEAALPDFAADLRVRLEAGGRFPEWTEEDVREILPDEGLRRGILAELRPRGPRFFTELFPAFGAWPHAPCGYMKFSPAYEGLAAEARRQGWPYREFAAGHFHMVVDPEGVTAALIELVESLRQ